MQRALWGRAQRLNWRRLGTLAGGGLAVVLVVAAFVFVYLQRDALVHHLAAADKSQLVAVFAWYVMALVTCVIGWVSIMHALGGRVSPWQHIRIYCLGNAAKRLPGTLWYVGGRVALYRQAGVPVSSVVLASGLEAALQCLSGVIMVLPFLAVIMPTRLWLWAASAGLMVLVLNPPVLRRLLQRTVHGWTAPRVAITAIYGWLVLYMIAWALGGGLMLNVIRIYEPVSLQQLPAVIESWTLSGVVSYATLFLPANFGVTEASLTVLLSRIVPPAAAALAAVSARLLLTLLDLLFGGLVAVLELGRRPK